MWSLLYFKNIIVLQILLENYLVVDCTYGIIMKLLKRFLDAQHAFISHLIQR